jgi:hypothetical protein
MNSRFSAYAWLPLIEHQPDYDRNNDQNLCYQKPGAYSRRLRRDNQYVRQ